MVIHGKKPGYTTARCGDEWRTGVWGLLPPFWLFPWKIPRSLLRGSSPREAQLQIVADDEISLAGFYEDGEYKPSSISNHATDESLTICDQSGRSMWAGRRGEGL